ncbi:Ephrin type-B receptor 1 [Holothuria leucospilota]|uniref:receptor protein-tyrosine kinase n=1 Tax=Holothuria leucospilota TaxID=206669 RepID=A0A9Q1CCY6_HOLLE|nr:Ephrin type-B receptor 1 [Holothuria leucospilota]
MKFVKSCIVLLMILAETCKSGILVEKLAGSMVILTCNSSHYQRSSPAANHYWWFNKQLMFGSDFKPMDIGLLNIHVIANNNSYSYAQISCISPRNQGNYTCRVGNETVSAYKLKVNVEGAIFSFVKTAILNSSITLTCCMYENHVWTFNNKFLFAGDKFQPRDIGYDNVKAEQVSSIITKLDIDRVSLKNAGNYTCRVEERVFMNYFLRVYDILLRLSIDGQDLSEVQFLLSGISYNITCSLSENLKKQKLIVSLTTFSSLKENHAVEPVNSTFVGFNTVTMPAAFSRNTKQCLVFCEVVDENDGILFEERGLLDIFVFFLVSFLATVIPDLVLQKDEDNITGIYKASVGDILELKCVAFGSRPAVDLQWKTGNQNNINYTKTVGKQNKFQESTQNFESTLRLVVEKSVIVTCYSSGMTHFPQMEAALFVEIDVWRELHYILVVGGISLIALLLLFISQMRLRLQRKRRENAELFALSVWQEKTSAVPKGDPDVAMVTFSSDECETRTTDTPNDTSGDCLSSCNSVTLLSRLHCGDHKEYWLGSYCSNNDHLNCICETVSVPYYVYRECIDHGTLRDFLLRNDLSYRGGETQGTDALLDGYNETKPHPITFARDVAEAMHFLHSEQFHHPALSTKKVLLDNSLVCKIYDFVPSELTFDKVISLKNKINPPTAWFPPETIFLDMYDVFSDIWTYGIFLWELFSFGEIPFQFKQRKEIEEEIRNMLSLPQPQTCPGALYSIMLLTWNKHREKRPMFAELIHQIHPLQKSFAEDPRDDHEWDEWNIDYFTLEEHEVQYSVPQKQPIII